MCGPGGVNRELLFGSLPGVRYIGIVDRRILGSLMRSASAIVVPSTYEGFGLPALEGMACGVPVVASAVGAFVEVCGTDALLVAPTAGGLAEGMLTAITPTPALQQMTTAAAERSRAFTWERAAARHLALYDSL
jgi:glycosyltransferase involved in cell wall biosynthesis